MKIFFYSISIILLATSFSVSAMYSQDAEEIENAKWAQKRTGKLIIAPQQIVGSASFSDKNSFEIGELVIFHGLYHRIIEKADLCRPDCKTFYASIRIDNDGWTAVYFIKPQLIGKINKQPNL